MKSKPNQKKILLLLVPLFAVALLLMQPVFSYAGPAKTTPVNKVPGVEKPARKSKMSSSRNNSYVKIYPDALRRVTHVVAKKNENKEIDFFVFDIQGTLILNYKMKPKDHLKISGLAHGSYIYRVFTGDLETASGNFEIR